MRSFDELTALRGKASRSDRVVTRLPVRFGLREPDRSAEAGNISEGGLYVHTDRVFAVGTRLELTIEFGERSFRHSCRVVWAIRVPEHERAQLVHGMGVQFVQVGAGWSAFFRAWRSRQAATEAR